LDLTREEERILLGERGWAKQISLKILVHLGEMFDAKRLIPIDSAHVSGVSYKTLGEPPIEFLKALADDEARVKIRTTLNPQGLDSTYLRTRIPENLQKSQETILTQYERMGLAQSLTCTPYYLQEPEAGSHMAWAESSALIYANSILGAWTNREGGPSALAAAIVGKTPEYGIHLPEERVPRVTVKLETRLKNETQLGALGVFLGGKIKDEVPAIIGLQKTSNDRLKQLCAGLGTSGMTRMFRFESAGASSRTEKMSVDARDIRETIDELAGAASSQPDLVFIGCPHCSVNEINEVAGLVEGRKVKPETEFWVCTSCFVKQRSEEAVKKIENAGGHVLDGVCTIVSWTEQLGIKTIMTNSAKTAYYAPRFNNAEALLAPMDDCLEAALRKRS
jgi:predicted aconitase